MDKWWSNKGKFGSYHFPIQGSAADYMAQTRQKVRLLGPPPEPAKANALTNGHTHDKPQDGYKAGDTFKVLGDYCAQDDYGYKALYNGLFPTNPHEYKPSREAVRIATLRKLWEDVAKSVHVRHPDPKARIRVVVTEAYGTTVRGKFQILARDTRDDPNKPFEADSTRGFTMPFIVADWPGEQIAKLYILGAYMLYMAHEATELVSDNAKLNAARKNDYGNGGGGWHFPDGGRVFNIHDNYKPEEKLMATDHWQRMHAVMSNDCTGGLYREGWPSRPEHPIELTISNLVGPTIAKDMWAKAKPIYAAELERLTDESFAASNAEGSYAGAK